ncbi:hypothetical protein D3C72_2483390 [compost metagenome]
MVFALWVLVGTGLTAITLVFAVDRLVAQAADATGACAMCLSHDAVLLAADCLLNRPGAPQEDSTSITERG